MGSCSDCRVGFGVPGVGRGGRRLPWPARCLPQVGVTRARALDAITRKCGEGSREGPMSITIVGSQCRRCLLASCLLSSHLAYCCSAHALSCTRHSPLSALVRNIGSLAIDQALALAHRSRTSVQSPPQATRDICALPESSLVGLCCCCRTTSPSRRWSRGCR